MRFITCNIPNRTIEHRTELNSRINHDERGATALIEEGKRDELMSIKTNNNDSNLTSSDSDESERTLRAAIPIPIRGTCDSFDIREQK